MNNKLLWVIGILVVAAVGFAVVRGQQTTTDTMMKEEEKMIAEPTGEMMEPTGASGNDAMIKEEEKMTGTTGAEDAMMEK